MTGTYQQVAETRPRVKRDVLYSQTPQGVLFHNSQAGFQLTSRSAYQFACALVPRLTGEHTVAELCGGLGPGQQAMVAELVRALLDRGFARDVYPEPDDALRLPVAVAERFAPQINYIDHYTGNAEERFDRFRSARVAVLGTDPMARWCALSLIRNGSAAVGTGFGAGGSEGGSEGDDDGVAAETAAETALLAERGCPVELVPIAASGAELSWADLRGFDVVVTTAGARRLTALLSSGIPEGVTLLPASVFGGQALVGPLMSAGSSGCWVCAALRFGANGPAGPAADVWSELVVPANGSAAAPSRPLAAMLGNLLAYEVFRLVTGALPAETEGHVIVQDLDSMDCATEALLAHPRCPFCGDAAREAAAEAEPLDGIVPRSPVTATVADADQGEEMLDELVRHSLLVRPTMGVFTEFQDDTVTQLPLKVGRVRLGIGHAERRVITAFDVHHVVGARLSALCRAAEVYAEHVVLPPGPLRAADADLPRIDPADLVIASGTGPGNGTGRAGSGGWVRATSLLSAAKLLVPVAAVHSFAAANRDGRFLRTSAGSGVGRSMPEAVGRALATALGHDALLRALGHERAVTRIPLDTLDHDPELGFLVRSARHLDLDLELLDISGPDPAAHVLVARAVDGPAGPPVWALGSDIGWQRAARDAMCDLIGRVQLARQAPGEPVDTGDPLLRALDPYTLLVKADAAADTGALSAWSAVLDDLRRSGREALAVPTGSDDLRQAGLSAVRVLLVGRG